MWELNGIQAQMSQQPSATYSHPLPLCSRRGRGSTASGDKADRGPCSSLSSLLFSKAFLFQYSVVTFVGWLLSEANAHIPYTKKNSLNCSQKRSKSSITSHPHSPHPACSAVTDPKPANQCLLARQMGASVLICHWDTGSTALKGQWSLLELPIHLRFQNLFPVSRLVSNNLGEPKGNILYPLRPSRTNELIDFYTNEQNIKKSKHWGHPASYRK